MNIASIIASFRDTFPTLELEVQTYPVDETVLTFPADSLHAAVRLLIESFDVYHLSTITGDDVEKEIVLLYHFWDGRGLTLRTSLPVDSPHIPTITDLIPGASFYEREVHDLYGVVFDGHPDLRPLLLPDDWEEGPEMYCQERVPSE